MHSPLPRSSVRWSGASSARVHAARGLMLGLLAVTPLLGCATDEGEAAAAPRCGADAEPCCAGASPCAAGLGCSASVCIAAPFAAGNACAADTECQSSVCSGALCAAPSCSDKVLNGDEGALDCGGSCPDRCPLASPCLVATDCAWGTCLQGATGSVCAFEPGGLLGAGGASDAVAWTQVAGPSDGLKAPTDLAFSPEEGTPLWIVDRQRDAFLVIHDPGTEKVKKRTILDISQHFLEEVLAISFDGHGSFGTCGDNRNGYGGAATPNDFMGPVQWPADLGHYPQGGSAHEQHWDMLHSTPLCVGIAGVGDDQFYCANGLIGSIDWYDFHEPHVPGGDDHADGEKRRFHDPKFAIKRVKGVPANLAYDASSELLYIADPGNGRVLRLDPKEATHGPKMQSFPLDGQLFSMKGFSMTALISADLVMPSGLELHHGTLYVADRGNGQLHAYDLEGKHLRSLDTGLGANHLGGLAAGPDDRLYLVDIEGRRVLRVDTTW